MRSRVVLPDPLSPRMVRNSPSAISSETLRKTAWRPNVLATLRMLNNVDFSAECALCVVGAAGVVGDAMNRLFVRRLLRRFHIVPNLVVLGAPRNVPPEINSFLVVVDVVQMTDFHFGGGHKLSGLRIPRNIVRFVGHQLLLLVFGHVFHKLLC